MNKFKAMTGKQRRIAEKRLREENAKFTDDFVNVPFENESPESKRIKVFRSRKFLVQVFAERDGLLRLSINRTALDAKGDWRADISWEELQEIKTAIGFADRDAVEIFPPAEDVVNVANMRHLWVLPEKLPFGWRQAA